MTLYEIYVAGYVRLRVWVRVMH